MEISHSNELPDDSVSFSSHESVSPNPNVIYVKPRPENDVECHI